jgi:hypothetical protein
MSPIHPAPALAPHAVQRLRPATLDDVLAATVEARREAASAKAIAGRLEGRLRELGLEVADLAAAFIKHEHKTARHVAYAGAGAYVAVEVVRMFFGG